MKKVAVIPARYASSRFPGKPLVMIRGRSMIRRVYEQVVSASLFDEVIIATDDKRIADHVKTWSGKVRMTKSSHLTGTERVAEVAKDYQPEDLIVNVQGDEPYIQTDQLKTLIHFMQHNAGFRIGTLARQLDRTEDLFDPDIVKLVKNKRNKALYFSRQAIPYQRDSARSEWDLEIPYFKHIGLYAYYQETLSELVVLPTSILEQTESLEQLRWLENGYDIGIAITDKEAISIDRPEDVDKLLKWLDSSGLEK